MRRKKSYHYKKKILTRKLFYYSEIFSDLYIKKKSLFYLTFKLCLIFESNSYLEFYLIRLFSKTDIFAIEHNENLG